MTHNTIISSIALAVDHNLHLTITSSTKTTTTTPAILNSINNCSISLGYLDLEYIGYLYFLSPLCLIGFILNIINLIVFSDRSFKNLTFKYLRLMAFVDCITCILVFIYCITNYTQTHTFNDKFIRTWYLVNVYFPLANITAACNVLLTLTVTIERLVSVRWPMEKQRLFSPNRVLITLIICFLFPVLANSVNFFAYKVGQCRAADLTSIARRKEYKIFGICKEILLRFIPICILICSNCLLLSTVHVANQKFQPQKKQQQQKQEIQASPKPVITTVFLQPASNGCDTIPINKYVSESQSQTDNLLSTSSLSGESTVSTTAPPRKSSVPLTSSHKMHIRKQQQEKQLTTMLVCVSTLYLCGQIPMLFAYPNFIFRHIERPSYKYYALVVNLLELITYLTNFFIYIKFTTQFQQVFRTKIKRSFFCLFRNA